MLVMMVGEKGKEVLMSSLSDAPKECFQLIENIDIKLISE